jgi:threonine synthase
VSLEEAIFKGLPSDNGLFLPLSIPKLDSSFFKNISSYSLKDIAFNVSHALIGDEINPTDLRQITDQAINFDAPVVNVHDNIYALELFHGPSLAFKDFGARFMASIMSYYLKKRDAQDINILVATSGDTGSAVAQGFFNMDKIKVTILYPSKKVSDIQERQLTTLGGNITALEVDGTFDDCQKMVKEAFLDTELCQKLNLSSANSINISRLIPQSFYYFYAYSQLPDLPLVVSVPSGNFGNLCGGLIAKQMGLPITKFIASTNINDVVPEYLDSGVFTPRPSTKTIANAMDVGNPSNFARLNEFYAGDVNQMREDIVGKRYTDDEVRKIVKTVYDKFGYIMDPHGAIGYMGLTDFLKNNNAKVNGIFLETAHPAKFFEDVEQILSTKINIPDSLVTIQKQKKHSIKINNQFGELKGFLLK